MPTNEEPGSTLGQEHDRAELGLRTALEEQRRSRERYDAASAGGSALLLAAVGLRAADQEVAARNAWLHWVDGD
jgi:hypothetical protein